MKRTKRVKDGRGKEGPEPLEEMERELRGRGTERRKRGTGSPPAPFLLHKRYS